MIVVPKKSGTFIDTATVVDDTPDPNLQNNSASIDYSAAPAPTVQSVSVQTFRGDLSAVVITFSAPMDQARASDPRNYALYLPNSQGAYTLPVFPSVATYQPLTNSVILTPSRLIPVGSVFLLSMNGLTSSGLADPGGRLLDGVNNGAPGSNYGAVFRIG
ncbi:MAG: hypothetical protein NVSMB14_14280 [Isosphaeraceae bacterium]